MNKLLTPSSLHRQIVRRFRRFYKSVLDWAFPEENIQWMRVVMERRCDDLVATLDHENMDVLEVSGDKWNNRHQWRSYKSVFYPDFDLCEASGKEDYDFIVTEQVFEHLSRPYHAGKNVLTLLRQGGSLLITTPFLIKIHTHPIDCTRWTELGLVNFLCEVGFERQAISSGCWGNRKCVQANLKGWINYRPSLHSLENEEEYPLVVWALAKKTVGQEGK